MKLDLTAFEKALQQLEKSYAYSQSPLAGQDKELFIQFRSASIQAFEYSYEIYLISINI